MSSAKKSQPVTLQEEIYQLLCRFPPVSWPVYNACPCCAKSRVRFLFKKWQVHHWICGSCKFVFTNPYPPKELLDELYDGSYTNAVRQFVEIPKAEKGSKDANNSMSFSIYDEMARRVSEYCVSGSWLDIGGGTGSFMARLSQEYPEMQCFLSEANSKSIDFAEKFYGLQVKDKSLDELIEDQHVYDVVSMMAVLEHITEPRNFLDKVKSILKPGGVLAINVPNFSSLSRKISRDASGAVTAPYHTNQFNRKALSKLLKRSGFEVREVWTNGPPSFAFMHFAKITTHWDVIIPTEIEEVPRNVQIEGYTPKQVRRVNALAKLDANDRLKEILRKIDGGVYLNMIAVRKCGKKQGV